MLPFTILLPGVPVTSDRGALGWCTVAYLALEDGQSIAPGLSVMALPGHTPGIMGLYYEKDKILFASDAVKKAWEFQRNEPPVTFFSKAVALENYAHIREKARIIVPGHDRHFTLGPDNSVQYLSRCRTEIRSYMDPEKDEPVRQFV